MTPIKPCPVCGRQPKPKLWDMHHLECVRLTDTQTHIVWSKGRTEAIALRRWNKMAGGVK